MDRKLLTTADDYRQAPAGTRAKAWRNVEVADDAVEIAGSHLLEKSDGDQNPLWWVDGRKAAYDSGACSIYFSHAIVTSWGNEGVDRDA